MAENDNSVAPYGLISLQIPSLPAYNEKQIIRDYNSDMPLEQERMQPTFSFFQPSSSEKPSSSASHSQKSKARITITP